MGWRVRWAIEEANAGGTRRGSREERDDRESTSRDGAGCKVDTLVTREVRKQSLVGTNKVVLIWRYARF